MICSFYISNMSFSKAATKTNPHYLSISSKSKIKFQHDLVIMSDQKLLPPEAELVGWPESSSKCRNLYRQVHLPHHHRPKGVPGELEVA